MEACIAATEAELEAVYRHRYRVYVEELGRYADRADHDNHRLVDLEDEWSEQVYVLDGGEVVASLRVTWGGHGFSERQIEHYSLQPFLAELPIEVLTIGERTMISPSHRGRDVFAALSAKAADGAAGDRPLIGFGACEPHLIAFYGRLQKPYADRNIDHESGYLVPLIAYPHGVDALIDVGREPGLPACVARTSAGTGAIVCSHLTPPSELLALVRATPGGGAGVLAALGDQALARLLRGSNVIRAHAGDRIVRASGTTTTLYVVLDGAVGQARPGQVTGASSALRTPRPRADATVAPGGATVLMLSEGTLRRAHGEDPETAAAIALALLEPDRRTARRTESTDP